MRFMLGVMGVILLAVPAAAFTPRTGSAVAVSERVHDDLYAAGGTVTVDAAIEGDVVSAGGTVILEGPVTGGVLAAGGTVTVAAAVSRNVRAAAGALAIGAPVGGDAVLAGGTVEVERPAQIGRDLVVGGRSVTVSGTVGRNAIIRGGDIVIAGAIHGDADIQAQRITLLSTTRIGGRLRYSSPRPIELLPGAMVAGGVERMAGAASPPGAMAVPLGSWLRLWVGVIEVAGLFIVGWVAFAVAPRGAATAAQEVRDRFWHSLLVGFVLLVTVPVAAVVLLFTVVGIPLSTIGILLYLATLYPGVVFVAAWVGDGVLRRVRKTSGGPPPILGSLAVGAIALGLLFAVPAAGWVFRLVAILVGFGALWATAWRTLTGHPSPPGPRTPAATA